MSKDEFNSKIGKIANSKASLDIQVYNYMSSLKELIDFFEKNNRQTALEASEEQLKKWEDFYKNMADTNRKFLSALIRK